MICRWSVLAPAVFSLGMAAAQPAVQAPNDPIRITSLKGGTFRLTQGKTQRIVDLHRNISGCWGRLFDGTQEEQSGFGDGGSVSTRVLDIVRRAEFWSVVLQVNTNSRCNVQGLCGAATNSDILWLKLTSTLAIAAQQAATVEACEPATELTRFSGRRPDELLPPALELSQGSLTLEYRTSLYNGTPAIRTVLQYDRRTPERGLEVRRR